MLFLFVIDFLKQYDLLCTMHILKIGCVLWVDFLIAEISFPQYMCLKFPWMITHSLETASQGERKFYLCEGDIFIWQWTYKNLTPKPCFTKPYKYIWIYDTYIYLHFNNPFLCDKIQKKNLSLYTDFFCFEIVTTRTNEECSNRNQFGLVLEDKESREILQKK